MAREEDERRRAENQRLDEERKQRDLEAREKLAEVQEKLKCEEQRLRNDEARLDLLERDLGRRENKRAGEFDARQKKIDDENLLDAEYARRRVHHGIPRRVT